MTVRDNLRQPVATVLTEPVECPVKIQTHTTANGVGSGRIDEEGVLLHRYASSNITVEALTPRPGCGPSSPERIQGVFRLLSLRIVITVKSFDASNDGSHLPEKIGVKIAAT